MRPEVGNRIGKMPEPETPVMTSACELGEPSGPDGGALNFESCDPKPAPDLHQHQRTAQTRSLNFLSSRPWFHPWEVDAIGLVEETGLERRRLSKATQLMGTCHLQSPSDCGTFAQRVEYVAEGKRAFTVPRMCEAEASDQGGAGAVERRAAVMCLDEELGECYQQGLAALSAPQNFLHVWPRIPGF
ncbi:unnamed protein product [Rangifer tarandus platyrhynchus]|uniref:Uncharacterized protein n=1 Tax=Rangifer tarandus platyrhynchus TaxID=3082113 RepID=A0AC59ZVK3_RANTA